MRDPGNEIAHLYEFCRRSGHNKNDDSKNNPTKRPFLSIPALPSHAQLHKRRVVQFVSEASFQ